MRRLLRRHFGTILGATALVAVALGTAGFRACDPACSVATALYRAVQMFYWNYFPWNTTAEATLPWTLEVARWLAPLVTLGAVFGVLGQFFQRQWDAFRAGRQSGHVILCGAGETARTLAVELLAGGTRVVLLERDPARAQPLADLGAIVLPVEVVDAATLQRAGVARAARLVAATDFDHENLTIALAAATAGTRLQIHVLHRDASLADLGQRARALMAGKANAVRAFDPFRNLARQTIADFPPESASGAACVILPDLGPLGRALATEYALVGHFPQDQRVRIGVVHAEAEAQVAVLRRQVPGFDHCADLEAVPLAAGESFATRVTEWVAKIPTTARLTIFPEFDDRSAAFVRALELHERLRDRAEVRLLLPHDPTIAALVAGHPTLRARLVFLPAPARTCGVEAIFGEALDRLARMIHERWLDETRQQIAAARATSDEARAQRHEAKATFHAWDDLSEEQKGASRSQADHIAAKIRAAGLDPATVTPEAWAQLPPAPIETLARMEHARWAAYLHLTGWIFAPERNDARREHPNLVSYDELDEPTKDYDRLAVRHVAHYLPALRR